MRWDFVVDSSPGKQGLVELVSIRTSLVRLKVRIPLQAVPLARQFVRTAR